ncbi:MAG: cobyrinate a,c-diamide synthase [Syntrophomonadaceae bacterium]|nr:cobyrinate a,c-diamide synthase [Syntrophomonadaceae bacterium]
MTGLHAFMIAGTHSGVGKTTLTAGVMAALRRRGLRVRPFKVGPDYIDTGYHRLAAGAESWNLDLWMLGEPHLRAAFAHASQGCDVAVVEGVMGLFDGVGTTPEGSSAEVAKLLGIPVVLVVDGKGMSTSAAAQVMGYRDFDPALRLAGVILNRVSGEGHFRLLRQSIERYTGVPVVGWLPRDARVALPSRHLGLLPAQEMAGARQVVERAAALVEEHLDLDALLGAGTSLVPEAVPVDAQPAAQPVRLAIARDEAFSFYYPSSLEMLQRQGAVLCEFSPLRSAGLPEAVAGLYLGGGFPEVFAEELASNRRLRESLRRHLEAGLPCYAECGGLMYLAGELVTAGGKAYPMVGFLDGRARMTDRLQRFGYVQVELERPTVLGPAGASFHGHEFHHSVVEGISAETAMTVTSTLSGRSWRCGFRRANVLAAYAHLDFWSNPELARHWLAVCRQWQGGC